MVKRNNKEETTDTTEDVQSYDVAVEEEAPAKEEVKADTGRVTKKPKAKEVTFQVHRTFTWHGKQLEPGEHTWPEDEYDAMSYDVNLRTDRLRLISRS